MYSIFRSGGIGLFIVMLFLLAACGPGNNVIDPDPPDSPPIATVKTDIGCRSGPTSDYAVMDTLKAGEILQIQGRSQKGDAWVIYNPDLGENCWVGGEWVDLAGSSSLVGIIDPSPPDKPSATVKAEAPCRSGPSAEYGLLAFLKPGEILDVQGRSPDGNAWVLFSTDLGGTCWVDAAWVDVAGALSLVGIINPDPPFKPAATATVLQNAVCRDGPTTEYRIIAYFNPGDVLNILGQNRQGTSWVVENPATGGQCWIAGNLVDVAGSTDLVMVIDPDPPTIILPTATAEDNPSPFNCAQYNTNPVACNAEPACTWDPSVLPNGECKNK